MKTIEQIRCDNMISLIKDLADNNQAKFGRMTGIDSTMISNYKNPKQNRNIGKDIARKIEKELSLAIGWMDKEHLKDEPSNKVSEKNIEVNQYDSKVKHIANMLQRKQRQSPELLDIIIDLLKLIPDPDSVNNIRKLTSSDTSQHNNSNPQ